MFVFIDSLFIVSSVYIFVKNMQEAQFLILAKKVISYISEEIDRNIHDNLVELDILDNDVISITSPDGQYIINKQTPAREIWLASPLTGPYHFCYTDNKWQTKKTQDLLGILNNELSSFLPLHLRYENI